MTTHHLILGTAGHIDHGKSSLIRALTGTDPDRLPEEKARGMTIELGFAHLDLPHPEDPQQQFSLGIIDVPGHADFVKNMVAGVGGINLALIAVAADDSWMPQTEEHVQILSYLGVEHAVVALTKADLAEDLSLAELDIREHLEGTPFADAPIVPTSATTGSGLDRLRDALARMAAGISPPVDCGKPRLSVDRVFSVKGIGTVVTGTLIGGSFTRGQPAIVQPQGTETRIRTLQSHNCELDRVEAGCRTAVGLHQVAIASRHEKHGLKRGDVITVPGTGGAADALGVLVETTDREIAGQAPSSKPLRHGQWVRFHHGGAAHNARLFFAEADRRQLPRGESAPAQLRFEEPVFTFLGDRFVLRDRGMRATLAGGIVLDPHARRRHFRDRENVDLLAARAKAPADPAVATSTRLAVDRVQQLDLLLRQAPFTPAGIEAGVQSLIEEKSAIRSGNWLLLASWWSELTQRAAALVDAQHQSRPQATGLPLADLSASLARELPDPDLFDVLVRSLTEAGFATSGKFVHRSDHQAKLPPALESAAAEIRRQLDADPLAPPGVKELTPNREADQAFRFLLESGEAIRLDPKVAISGATYQSLVEKVRQFISANGPATASQLRDATGTTRRVLIPLLEHLDTDRVTIRNGDVRSLRN